MSSEDRPEILLLSLSYRDFFDQTYAPLIDGLAKGAILKRVKTASAAIRALNESNLSAIIITDEGLTKRSNQQVLFKVVEYVRNGGYAIAGLHFPSFTRMDAFKNFFAAFGLPWENGDYHRTDFEFHRNCALPPTVITTIPGPYSMKALHIKNAELHEKIFVPVGGAQTQSHVFPADCVDESQAAITGAHVGDGFLVYCGDVNGESGSDQVILTLLGLLH
ncbi:hypothetical protein BDV12DRAFT_167141 [Aspergillus spectabilis]